jgi:hypothetical protein
MHFPNHAGTMVEVIFLQGNINCPVIIGALSTPAVVHQDNCFQARLLTKGGHEWRFDDTPDQESILLTTPNQTDSLVLKANPREIGIALTTEKGEMDLFAAQGMHWQTPNTLSIQATDYDVLIKTHYHLEAMEKITWKNLEDARSFFSEGPFYTIDRKKTAFCCGGRYGDAGSSLSTPPFGWGQHIVTVIR